MAAGPTASLGSTRNPFLLRMLFAHRMPLAQTLSMLEDYRAALQRQLTELTSIADKLEAVGTSEARSGQTAGMAKNPLPFWLLGGIGVDDVWLAGPALVGALLEAGLRNGVDATALSESARC